MGFKSIDLSRFLSQSGESFTSTEEIVIPAYLGQACKLSIDMSTRIDPRASIFSTVGFLYFIPVNACNSLATPRCEMASPLLGMIAISIC